MKNNKLCVSFFVLALAVIASLAATPVFAQRSKCDVLGGEDRRQCIKAEVAAGTAANREAAAAEREKRKAARDQFNATRSSQQPTALAVAAPANAAAGEQSPATRDEYLNNLVCRDYGPEKKARCIADMERRTIRAKTMAESGADENGVRRKPGPGCVPYSQYAINCKTDEEQRVLRGAPSKEEEEARTLQDMKDDAAARSAKPAPECASISKIPYTVRVTIMDGYETQSHGINTQAATRYHQQLTNRCSFPITVEIWGYQLKTLESQASIWVEDSGWDNPRHHI